MGNKKILIAGCGYVGCRLADDLGQKGVSGLVRTDVSSRKLADMGVIPLRCDLALGLPDMPSTRGAEIYYLLPPPKTGVTDSFLVNFLRGLELSGTPKRILYLGTTGVYGDCGGRWVDESAPLKPTADRALRRLDAEQQLLDWVARRDTELVRLRVAGIYGPGKLPLQRLRAGKPMVAEKYAPWTNRIHVDDLVRVLQAAMSKGRDGEVYNVSDGQPGNMAAYFNTVADHAGLPRPPVLNLEQASGALSAGLRSYLAESRRIDNRKMLRELGVALRYPSLEQGLKDCFSPR